MDANFESKAAWRFASRRTPKTARSAGGRPAFTTFRRGRAEAASGGGHGGFLLLLLFAFISVHSRLEAASTVISATLSITNSAALTNATSGQSYTLNSDTRTFTNSVASAATQVRVLTNYTAAQILLSLVGQAGQYPFTAITSMTTSGGTNVTFRATNDTALTITLSPTNWGKVTYSTQTVGTVQSIIRVPQSAEASGVASNLMSQLWADLDAYSAVRQFSGGLTNTGATKLGSTLDVAGRAEFDAGLGLHGVAKTNSYTVTTNDLYLGLDTRSNTNLILTLPSASSASNLLFLIKDEGGAGATNTIKIYPASGDRIDTLLTNLVISNNYGGVQLRSRGSTNWAVLATGGGVTGGIASSGGNVVLTNSVWVAKSGNDGTGIRGDLSKPFLTLGAAKTAASSGDTIFVLPGTYNERDLLKNLVNWHFFSGSIINYTGSAGGGIFDDNGSAVTSRITGSGVFTNSDPGGYYVLSVSDSSSDIYFQCTKASGGSTNSYGQTVVQNGNGRITIDGGEWIGWHAPAMSLTGNVTVDGAILDGRLNDDSFNGAGLTVTGTNVVLRNCTVFGASAGMGWSPPAPYSIYAGSAATVTVEGTLSVNSAPHGNVTVAGISGDALTIIPGAASFNGTVAMQDMVVTNTISAPTNTAPFNIDVTDFALDTNYTNGTQRAFVSASVLLSANAADTAQVALYLDQDADTAFEQTGLAVSANGLTTNSVQISGWIQPGGVFTFTNLSTGAATAAVNAGGSQWVKQ